MSIIFGEIKLMNKNIIVIAVIISLMSFVGYRFYDFQSFLEQAKKFRDLNNGGRAKVEPNDSNFPDYLKKYYIDESVYKSAEKIFKIVSSKDDIYDTEANNQLILEAEPLFAKDIDNFKSIVPTIKKRMEEPKKSVAPSIKESEKLPSPPSIKTVRGNVRYWYDISRLLEKREDYETSLYLSLAVFYIAKDYQTNYVNGSEIISRIVADAISGVACDSILVWAGKPRPQCGAVSKEIAKDILELVKSEYPVSVNIEYERFLFESMLDSFESKGYRVLGSIRKTSYYKKLLDLVYKKTIDSYDKPIYEIKKEMKSNHDERQKILYDQEFSELVWDFLFNSDRLKTTITFGLSCPNFEKFKIVSEKTKAKMEMAAIALAINSYYCENSKLPESMEELSKWFGQELPKNRLTNEPYELDFKGKHVLYNEFYDFISKEKKEFYYNFSLE